jgi:hypothetical protein
VESDSLWRNELSLYCGNCSTLLFPLLYYMFSWHRSYIVATVEGSIGRLLAGQYMYCSTFFVCTVPVSGLGLKLIDGFG